MCGHKQRVVESCSVQVRWDMRVDPRRVDLPLNKCVVAVSDVDIDLTKRQCVAPPSPYACKDNEMFLFDVTETLVQVAKLPAFRQSGI